MTDQKMSRRASLKQLGALGLAAGTVACSKVDNTTTSPSPSAVYTAADIDLSTPEKRSEIVTKVMGSIAKETTHIFMRFHIYGFTGENAIPLFSMNNYVIQKWEPVEPGTYQLFHYEVGYYCEFDTDKPIDLWLNPITGEEIELEHFVLGPVSRLYTPDGIIAPGIAPQPLRVNVIGDRVFVPAQSIESFPTMFSPEEWPKLSAGPKNYWDSMYTYSASLQDVANPDVSTAHAEIHMQNLTSWQPFLRLGGIDGRTMARAFGTNVSGFDALEPNILAAFKKYTPDIFETDTWTEMRFDSIDYYQKMVKQREAQKQS